MRTADFKAGLTRVAAAGLAITLLLTGTWYAARESAGLESQRLSAELNQLEQRIASTQLQLDRERVKTDHLEKELQTSGKTAGVALAARIQQQLLQAQAQANQYKAIIEREQQGSADNSRLVAALTNPGAHLLPMKGAEAAAETTAYTLLVENSRLLFIGSNLPKLADGRLFQLWVVRKQDPKWVSAGVFNRDDGNRAIVSFENGSVLSEIATVEVTDEPQEGSSEPTGTKLLETGNNPPETARAGFESSALAQQVFKPNLGVSAGIPVLHYHRRIE